MFSVISLFMIDILHVYFIRKLLYGAFLDDFYFRSVKMTSYKSSRTRVYTYWLPPWFTALLILSSSIARCNYRTLWQRDCNMFPVRLFLFSRNFSVSRASSHCIRFIHLYIIGNKTMGYNMNVCIDAYMERREVNARLVGNSCGHARFPVSSRITNTKLTVSIILSRKF